MPVDPDGFRRHPGGGAQPGRARAGVARGDGTARGHRGWRGASGGDGRGPHRFRGARVAAERPGARSHGAGDQSLWRWPRRRAHRGGPA